MTLKSFDNNVDHNLQVIIHPAAIEDTRAISSVLAKSFYNFPEFASWIYPFLQFTINEDLRYRLRSHSPLYCCLVAKLAQPNNQNSVIKTEQSSNLIIVGTVEITLRSPALWSTHLQYPYISNLAVKKDYRRFGIGSQLLARCEQIALDWGYQETRLHVLDDNNSAKQLYKNNGYQISRTEANWGNVWFDYSPRLLLKKQISAN
ncbi:MAG: GNAT family N-acetyltransferase [Waterburya sp.]